MTGGLPDPAVFGAAFEDFMRVMSEVAVRPQSPLGARLCEHLGAEPGALPSTVAEFAVTDHPNLQLALDAVLPDAEVVGLNVRHAGMAPLSIADVIVGHGMTGPIAPGPVQEVAVEVGDGRVIACVATGMYLAVHHGVAVAPLLSPGGHPFGGGRHLKRGVLLHGPPGTGKTLSVTYLLGAMPGRTTVLLTGRGLGLIEQALVIARELAPATVVFEDVDLVAAERTMHIGAQGVLFELLNQMEGIDEDADLLFVLTTNRPDVIEPALAARPGRVDLALEIPLPDADARRRLIRLYAGDVELDDTAVDELVARTERVSGAFIKELMRQAALRAALAGSTAAAADVKAALDELLDE